MADGQIHRIGRGACVRAALYAGGAVVGVVALYVLAKKRPGESVAGAAGRVVASAAGDAAVGVVKGAGAVVGIPDTNMTQCQADLVAGRTWDASFSCPAKVFAGSVFNGSNINNAAQSDQRQIDRIIEREAAQPVAMGGVYNPVTGEIVGQYDEMGYRIY
jgi:hypothetical protein